MQVFIIPLLAIVGYIINIADLAVEFASTESLGSLGAFVILQAVGVVLAPLGVICGYIAPFV